MIPHDVRPALNEDQRARAEAVRVACDVLAPQQVGGRGGVDMLDVMHLAAGITTDARRGRQ